MSALDTVSAAWSEAIFRACWQGLAFIILAAAACCVIRQLTPAMRCAIWCIACAKLVLGVCWIAPPAIPVLPPVPAAMNVVSPGSTVGVDNLQFGGPMTERPRANAAIDGGQDIPAISHRFPANAEPLPTIVTSPAFWFTLWAIGVCLGIGIRSIRVIRTVRLIRDARRMNSPRIESVVAELSISLGIRKPPGIFESNLAAGPMVVGFFRPIIVLPLNVSSTLSSVELRLAVAHELAHIKRCDLWTSVVPSISQTLFFFFPPAWFAAREFAFAREEACDEAAMRLTETPALDYGRLLLRFVAAGKNSRAIAALSSTPCYRTLERRLKMLPDLVKIRKWNRWTAAAIGAATIVCFLPFRLVAQDAATGQKEVAPETKRAVPVDPAVSPKPESVQNRLNDTRSVKPKAAPNVAAPKPSKARPALPVPLAPRATMPLEAQTRLAPPPVSLPVEPLQSTKPVPLDPSAVPELPANLDPALTKPIVPRIQRHAGQTAPAAILPQDLTTPTPLGSQTATEPVVKPAPVDSVTPDQRRRSVPADPTIASPRVPRTRRGADVPALPLVSEPRVEGVPMLRDVPVVGRLFQLPASADKKLSLELENVTCYDALLAAFKKAGVDYRIDGDAARSAANCPLTMKLTNASLRKVLQMITNATARSGEPITFRYEDGVYVVGLSSRAASRPSRLAPAAVSRGAPIARPQRIADTAAIGRFNPRSDLYRKVTLIAKDADVRFVLKDLFQQVGANYALDQRVQGKVTVNLTDVPFRTALDSILRTLQSEHPVTWTLEDTVFKIVPRTDSPTSR